MAAQRSHPHDTDPADLVLAALLAGRAMDNEVARRLVHDGYDMRGSDRAVFALLATGPATVTGLARSLGISQQATSKALTDLELRGYVERASDRRDARIRPAGLTAEGERLVSADRHHRAALHRELAERLGGAPVDSARILLNAVIALFSNKDHEGGRRLRALI